MDEYLELLVQRMTSKGFGLEMTLGLLREVASILSGSKYTTCELVNEKLVHLGWGESVLDEVSLQLIISILEQQGVLRAQAYTLH